MYVIKLKIKIKNDHHVGILKLKLNIVSPVFNVNRHTKK